MTAIASERVVEMCLICVIIVAGGFDSKQKPAIFDSFILGATTIRSVLYKGWGKFAQVMETNKIAP